MLLKTNFLTRLIFSSVLMILGQSANAQDFHFYKNTPFEPVTHGLSFGRNESYSHLPVDPAPAPEFCRVTFDNFSGGTIKILYKNKATNRVSVYRYIGQGRSQIMLKADSFDDIFIAVDQFNREHAIVSPDGFACRGGINVSFIPEKPRYFKIY